MNPFNLQHSVRFYTPLGDTIVLDGLMAGAGPEASAFLVAGGPSLGKLDLSLLQQRGVFTLAINNAWSLFRPNSWVFSDSPGSFIEQGWFDPGIMKFAPVQQREGRLVRSVAGELKEMDWKACHAPNTWFYPRNAEFDPDTFFTEPSINWGQDEKIPDKLGLKGGRSTLLVAIRLLTILGFRRINLLGVDFKMEAGRSNYAFEQERTASAIAGNNQSYNIQKQRLAALKPHLDKAGIEVFNCNPESELKVFPYRSFEEAIDVATQDCRTEIVTAGRYEKASKPISRAGRREHELKKYRHLAKTNPNYGATCHGRDAVDLVCGWKPKRVLDCGCGRNGFKELLKPHGVEVFGADPVFPEADFTASMHSLPFRAEAFDGVTAFDVLEHLIPEDVVDVLDELRRVTKPGGHFCFSIAYTPSRHTVNGENLHPTVRTESWWTRQIRRVSKDLHKQGRYLHGSFK